MLGRLTSHLSNTIRKDDNGACSTSALKIEGIFDDDRNPCQHAAEFSTTAFGADLHQFIEQYEAAYPQEVLHIEEPLRAEWEITALAMKLEKAQRFPILVCHNVIVDGKRAELPLVTFLDGQPAPFGAHFRRRCSQGRSCLL